MLGSARIYSFITLACVFMSISFSSIAKRESSLLVLEADHSIETSFEKILGLTSPNTIVNTETKKLEVSSKKSISKIKSQKKKAPFIAKTKKNKATKALEKEVLNINELEVLEDEVKSIQASIKSETKLDQGLIKKKTPKFSAVLDVTFQTNTNQFTSDEKSLSATNWLFLNYQINSLYKARLWLSYSKDLATSYEDTLNNTRLTFSRQAFQITEKFSLSPSANLLIPTSEVARRSQSLNGGIELGTSFKYKFNEKIGGSYFVRAGKNFHDFTTSEDNKVNAEYTLLQILSLSFSITEKIYFSPALIYNNNWSYLGTQRDPTYTTWLELGYILSDKLSLGLGASTGGSLENRQNGPDQTINIIDRNTTNYFAKFALRF